MLLINCEINLILTWSENFVTSEENRLTIFAIADTKLYVLVLNLSMEDNTKLMQQLKWEFKCTINSNKSKSKATTQSQNRY